MEFFIEFRIFSFTVFKEIRDTEFLEVSTRIYNELLGFASEKFDILNIKEFI